MLPESDLGIYSDVPFLDRLMRISNIAMWVLVVNPLSGTILDIIVSVLFIFVISSKLRTLPHTNLFGFFIIVILIIVTVIYGTILLKLFPVLERLVLGDSVFGRVGGMPRKIFFTSLKLAHTIKYEFNEQDSQQLKDHGALDRDLTEAWLRWSYRKNVYEKMTPPLPDFESAWTKLWNETILKVGTEGRTLRDALTSDEVAFSMIPLQLIKSRMFVSPFIKIFQLILIYVLARYLNGASPLVSVIQACVALSFVFSILWFIHHAYKLNEIEYIGVIDELPNELQNEFGPRLKRFHNLRARPTKITLKKRYLSLVRNYLVTSLGRDLLLNALFSLVLVGGTLVIGRLAFSSQFNELSLWYRQFAMGFVLISLGFLGSYYVSFWILQNVRRIVAPVVASLVGALSPFGINFVLTGKLELSQLTNQFSAALAGVGILFTATISSLVKKKLEDEE
jgi:hypothetical protein